MIISPLGSGRLRVPRSNVPIGAMLWVSERCSLEFSSVSRSPKGSIPAAGRRLASVVTPVIRIPAVPWIVCGRGRIVAWWRGSWRCRRPGCRTDRTTDQCTGSRAAPSARCRTNGRSRASAQKATADRALTGIIGVRTRGKTERQTDGDCIRCQYSFHGVCPCLLGQS